jgi:hypothetical protein
MCGKKPLQNF